MYHILDNTLSSCSLNFLYKLSLECPVWSFNRSSHILDEKKFAGVSYSDNYTSYIDNSIYGYNLLLYQTILSKFKSDVLEQQPIPSRIHQGAKYLKNVGVPHRDSEHVDDTTILFFNNPVWKKEWGGGIIVEDNLIDYIPGRAIIFPSVFQHYVSPIEHDDCPIRLATNFIFRYNFKSLKNADI